MERLRLQTDYTVMYLNLIQLAESFGVPEDVVDGWIREGGLPHIADRGRLLFDRAEVAHWAAAHGLTARAGFLSPAGGAFTSGFPLLPMLRAGGIWRDVAAADLITTLDRIVSALPAVAPGLRALLGQRLRAPGGLNWAPIGRGIALPHFSTRIALGRDAGLIALVLLREGLPLADAPNDGVPITRLLFFIPPSPRAHLDMLARLTRAISKGPLAEALDRSAPDVAVQEAFAETDAAVAERPGMNRA